MEKRGFYLVVIIEEENKTKKQKSSNSNQMLFMLTAKSGDDRTKWLNHLQAVIGSKSNKSLSNEIDSSKSSQISLTKQASDASLLSSSTTISFDTTGLDSNKNQLDAPKVGGLTDDEKLLRSKTTI
jgi:hypothetical protein